MHTLQLNIDDTDTQDKTIDLLKHLDDICREDDELLKRLAL